MLEIINTLKPFFEDNYRRINIREYAREMKVSPPTASAILVRYMSENLLTREKYRNFLFFHANKQSKDFIDLSRIYWRQKLGDLIDHLEKKLASHVIILFGSLSKAEAKNDSDIDLAIFSEKRDIDLSLFEKKLKRKVQAFWFKSLSDISNKELANNVINGYILSGKLWTGKNV